MRAAMRNPRLVRIAARLAAVLIAATAGAGVQAYTVSQYPALVTAPPPPNIVMTIDDSGSMQWAYAPDFVGGNTSDPNFTYVGYNGMYYNPCAVYPVPPGAGGTPVYTPSFTSAAYEGFHPTMTNGTSATVDLSTSYVPTTQISYPRGGTGSLQVSQAGGSGGPAYYYWPVGATCAHPPASTVTPLTPGTGTGQLQKVLVSTSSGIGPAGVDETLNFANWFSFYRTRHLAIVSATAIAMNNASLANVRLAWQALNSCALPAVSNTGTATTNCYGWSNVTNYNNSISQFTNGHKSDFYSWLFEVPTNNSTPTRVAWMRAGGYYMTSGPNSPYGLNPNPSLSSSDSDASVSSSDLQCVNNFQVTVTDGLWNHGSEGNVTAFCSQPGNKGSLVCGNLDAATATFPDKTTYDPSGNYLAYIYGDNGTSATSSGGDNGGGADANGDLADIAFYYWSTNLRPDLTNFHVAPYVPNTSTVIAPSANGTSDNNWPYWNPQNDPATWPHLVNFTIGVGLQGFLDMPGLVWNGSATAGTAYNNLWQGASNCLPPTASSSGTGATGTASSKCTWPQVVVNSTGGGNTGSGYADAGNVYDLWHAAINSRGNAFSAQTPSDLVAAMGAIFARVEGQSVGNSGAAGSSSSLTANTELILASYSAADWHGTVTAYGVNASTGAVNGSPDWQTTASSLPSALTRANTVFTANAALPITGAAQTASPGVHFGPSSSSTASPSPTAPSSCAPAGSGSALPATILAYFGDTASAQDQAICYVLGDVSGEQRYGGYFRNRDLTSGGEITLGDISDSSPVFSWKEDFGYSNIPAGTAVGTQGGATYAAYLTQKGNRPAVAYVGANDGMLHAFDATPPGSGSYGTPGTELFAYVPHSVLPRLATVTGIGTGAAPVLAGVINPSYAHVFYEDGATYVGDAYIQPAGQSAPSWHTVAVGTTGAGGQGIFALDVTNPANMSPGNVLWDLDGSAAGSNDANLGYSIVQPVVALTNSGDWAVVFGNGYLSCNGHAVLYVVRLVDGALLAQIDASANTTITGAAVGGGGGTACPAGVTGSSANGLGSASLLDVDQNGSMDYAYAGDLQGNLWKFDLTSPNPANWKVAYSVNGAPAPLFQAKGPTGAAQPIVLQPNFGLGQGGPMAVELYVVTGHIFATGDSTDTSVQSLYAVQDLGVPITGGRSALTPQTIVAATGGNENIQQPYRSVNPGGSGWYVDFPGLGERVLTEPSIVGGLLLFTSVVPQAQPCNGGCSGFIYALDRFTGDGGTGYLTVNGTSYDALGTAVGCVKGLTLISSGSTLNWYVTGNGGSSTPTGGTTGGSNGPGGPGNNGSFLNTLNGGSGAGSSAIQHGQGTMASLGRISWHAFTP